MAQAQHAHHAPARTRSLPESLSESSVDKVRYLMEYLTAGLNEEGSCKIAKREVMRAIGFKRFGKEAYKFIYEFMPKNRVKAEDVRILEVGADVMLIDVNRLESFSTMLTASEDN